MWIHLKLEVALAQKVPLKLLVQPKQSAWYQIDQIQAQLHQHNHRKSSYEMTLI